MNKVVAFFVFLYVVVLCNGFAVAQAQEITDKQAQKIDAVIKEQVTLWGVPGMSVAIVKGDKVIYSKGYGYRDVENELEVTPETVFGVGSNTKSFTAMALGLMQEKNKIDLNKPVVTYLPAFKLKDDYVTLHATPIDLIYHKTGLPGHDLVWYYSDLSTDEIIERLKYLDLNTDFRKKWQYNNMMFAVLGKVIAQVSGKTYNEVIQENILTPLEMNDTSFSVEDIKNFDNVAKPYAYDEENKAFKLLDYYNMDNVTPCGGLNSNALDMANYLILNLNKGKFKESQVVKETTMKFLHTPQTYISAHRPMKEMGFHSYSPGWVVTTYNNQPLYFHNGEINGFHSSMSMLPEQELGIVVLTNSRSSFPDMLPLTIYDILQNKEPYDLTAKHKEFEEAEAKSNEYITAEIKKYDLSKTKPSHPLKDYAGKYSHPAYGEIEIVQEGKDLKALTRSMIFPMEHYNYDTFSAMDKNISPLPLMNITFVTNTKGEIDVLTMPLESVVDPIKFKRLPPEKTSEEK